jgi:DNA-binding response OmpR family regulator
MSVELWDINRLILAEDDLDVAHGIRQVLEALGGYEVWVTRLRADVMSLLTKTHAMWLVLDLNLEDAYSGDLLPDIRRLWGNNVYVIVLSGHYDKYPEHELLGKGADNFLRKPYAPKALISLISRTRMRLEQGADLQPHSGLMLRIGDGMVDLERGLYSKEEGRDEIYLTDLQRELLNVLASARQEGEWLYLDRANLILQLWAEDYSDDPFSYSNRLRQLKSRTTRTLGVDPIEIRTGGGSSRWRLDPKVVEIVSA